MREKRFRFSTEICCAGSRGGTAGSMRDALSGCAPSRCLRAALLYIGGLFIACPLPLRLVLKIAPHGNAQAWRQRIAMRHCEGLSPARSCKLTLYRKVIRPL
jgi:hypothetical protein